MHHRVTCFHEAGHFVASGILFGTADDFYARVFQKHGQRASTFAFKRGRRRNLGECRSLVERLPTAAYRKRRPRLPPRSRRRWHEQVMRRELAISYAGCLAEAKYTKRSQDEAFVAGGSGDLDDAARILSWFTTDADERAEMRRDAREWARRIVIDEWARIERVAAALERTGRIKTNDPIFHHVWTGAPKRRAWWRRLWSWSQLPRTALRA